ncbi:hypothetical protein [Pseudomonas sp. 24 E 13]|nr:hypothetical protein [Pseudomonas sp. 24 E 13]
MKSSCLERALIVWALYSCVLVNLFLRGLGAMGT